MCFLGSSWNDFIHVRFATSAVTATGRMGLPLRRRPSSYLRKIAAPTGWTPRRMSEPPPAVCHRFAYSACDPLCDSSPMIRMIVDPLVARRRLTFTTGGA
jgi:hypothetical protein